MVIGIDFDGTCTTHDFPKIVKDIGAIPILKKLLEKNHKLILFTMRSDEYLTDAVNWFKNNNIELYGIQTNPTQKQWTLSPKTYCQLYIDDAGLGLPLITNVDLSNSPYVDWDMVELMLIDNQVL